MKVWGTIEIPQKIEFVSYCPDYHDQVLDVIRKSFFQYETVSVGSEIDKNVKAQKELELLCDDVLKKSGVSLMARDIENDKIIGASLNVIQVKSESENFLSEILKSDLHFEGQTAVKRRSNILRNVS